MNLKARGVDDLPAGWGVGRNLNNFFRIDLGSTFNSFKTVIYIVYTKGTKTPSLVFYTPFLAPTSEVWQIYVVKGSKPLKLLKEVEKLLVGRVISNNSFQLFIISSVYYKQVFT